tara:strand:+ start:1752 stop:1958 length:207 start_codon:yes stop_codon:yes gene_type:complete
MTNEEFVKDLMTFNPHGALAQVFVLEAIRKYSEQVVAADPKLYDSGFIDGSAWHGMAAYILDKIENRT